MSEWDRIEKYKEQFNDGSAIANIWTAEDVLHRAKATNITLSKEEAIEILGTIEHRFDANLGINWDNIDWWIGSYVTDRNNGESP